MSDPSLRELQKLKDRERNRRNRQRPKTDEQKARVREQARLRMAKSRAKKKAEEAAQRQQQASSSCSGQPRTRAQEKKDVAVVKAQREKWAAYKRQERSKWTGQKWRRHREKLRQRYHMNKDKQDENLPPCGQRYFGTVTAGANHQLPDLQSASPLPCPVTPPIYSQPQLRNTSPPPSAYAAPYPSKSALRKAKYRMKKLLMRVGKKVKSLQGVDSLGRKKPGKPCTPQSKRLKEKVDRELDSLKQRRDKKSLAKRKLLLQLQIDTDSVKVVTSPYKRKKQHVGVLAAKEFLEEVSVPLPTKKSVSKKSHTQSKVLPKRLRRLHQDFLRTNPQAKASLRSMYRHRGKHIKTNQRQVFRQCLCEICANVDLVLDILNSHLEHPIDGRDALSELSLCSVPSFSCLERTCPHCGVDAVRNKLLGSCKHDLSLPVKWFSWEMVKREKGQRKEKVPQEGSLQTLIDTLLDRLVTLSKHIVTHRWQHTQYKLLLSKLPLLKETAVVVVDFAENYLCKIQDEVQSAHWGYNQVTVHPCVVYYACKCGDLVTEYIVVLSDDLLHDAHMVKDITNILKQHLEEKGIHNIVMWSDGCASQYKSKLPFFFASESGLEWVFFGSRHGKSACDACGGVVKTICDQDVRDGACIQNAKQMYENLVQNHCLPEQAILEDECCHTFRSFKLLHNVQRDLPSSALNTVPGTRRIQHIKGLGGGQLLARNLACFCDCCFGLDETATCPSSHLVQDWVSTEVAFRRAWLNTHDGSETPPAQQHSSPTPASPSPPPPDRKRFFSGLQRRLQTAKSYSEVEAILHQHAEEVDSFAISAAEVFVTTIPGAAVDGKSLLLLPKDAPSRHFPLVVDGDGNCLPRSLSLLAFGTQDHHEELRVRLVLELVRNAKQYVSPSYLSQNSAADGETLLKMLLDDVDLTDRTGLSPMEIFKAELCAISKPFAFMNMWAVYAAANVLKAPVISVYPDKGESAKQALAKRTIMPSAGTTASTTPCHILWTSNREGMLDRWWLPNHFVPLLPLHPEEGPSVEEVEEANTAFVEDVSVTDHVNRYAVPDDPAEEPSLQDDAANTAFVEDTSSLADCMTRFPVPEEFYILQWADKKDYVCQVKEIDLQQQEVLVHFMDRQGSFVFWNHLDESWENIQTFLANSRRVSICLNEKFSNHRRQLFEVVEL